MPARPAPRRPGSDHAAGEAGVDAARPRLPAQWALAVGAAVVLSVVFWAPLWRGGGLIGGDVYSYYFPQKVFLVDCLERGDWPLWNDRSGHGYPAVAESQTGVLYPPYWVAYSLLDLNAAYNTVQLLHYLLAFVAMWLYARTLGLRLAAALLAALVYTYAWFPPRVCWEWAIVGGAWLPVALWCVERGLQTRHWRYAIGLSGVLSLQMLAGHFNLAFLTQLVLLAYVPARLWWAHTDLPEATRSQRRSLLAALLGCLAAAFLLSAAQLLPTWELRQLSQRSAQGTHDPAYGYIPPAYLGQMVQPWYWYADPGRFEAAVSPGGPATNPVEAHLYLGLLPLLLAGWGLVQLRRAPDRRLLAWAFIGGAALLYATGALVPVARHLPGFSFFQGAGRYGLLTTLAGALLAGAGLQQVQARLGRWGRWLPLLVLVLTTADLWLVSRLVTYATLLEQPPVLQLDRSPLRQILAAYPAPPRLYGPASNLATQLGVTATPPYLGLGPAAYYDPQRTLPPGDPFAHGPTPAQLDWLRRAGVTHILSFTPLAPPAWPVQPVWQGFDPFLNGALARYTEPLYLYELEGSRGRVAWIASNAHGDAAGAESRAARVRSHRPNRVEVEADSPRGGRLVLTDLAYPGWEVTVDGVPAAGLVVDGMYRGVDLGPGPHVVVWNYRPRSVYWGTALSGAALLLLLAVAHVRFWHPHWLTLRHWRNRRPDGTASAG